MGVGDMSDMDELPVMQRFEKPPGRGVLWWVGTVLAFTSTACVVLAAALVGADGRAHTARTAQRRAEAALTTEKARPPQVVVKTETKVLPTFGRSVLMGVFAAGAIQQGVYDSSGNMSVTPNDATCSTQYTSLSNQYTAVSIDRPTFMTACEASLSSTMKRDPAQ